MSQVFAPVGCRRAHGVMRQVANFDRRSPAPRFLRFRGVARPWGGIWFANAAMTWPMEADGRDIRIALETAQAELRTVKGERDAAVAELTALKAQVSLLEGGSSSPRSSSFLVRMVDVENPAARLFSFLRLPVAIAAGLVFYWAVGSDFLACYVAIATYAVLQPAVRFGFQSMSCQFGEGELRLLTQSRRDISLITQNDVQHLPYSDVLEVHVRRRRLSPRDDVVLTLRAGGSVVLPGLADAAEVSQWLTERIRASVNSHSQSNQETAGAEHGGQLFAASVR
jgi:hypothetical protein